MEPWFDALVRLWDDKAETPRRTAGATRAGACTASDVRALSGVFESRRLTRRCSSTLFRLSAAREHVSQPP